MACVFGLEKKKSTSFELQTEGKSHSLFYGRHCTSHLTQPAQIASL